MKIMKVKIKRVPSKQLRFFIWLVVDQPTPFFKDMLVKMGFSHLPQFFKGENLKKSLSCHHLVMLNVGIHMPYMDPMGNGT